MKFGSVVRSVSLLGPFQPAPPAHPGRSGKQVQLSSSSRLRCSASGPGKRSLDASPRLPRCRTCTYLHLGLHASSCGTIPNFNSDPPCYGDMPERLHGEFRECLFVMLGAQVISLASKLAREVPPALQVFSYMNWKAARRFSKVPPCFVYCCLCFYLGNVFGSEFYLN